MFEAAGKLLSGMVICLIVTVAGAADRRLNTDLTAQPQGEVAIAVNPNDPQHLVAAWIDWDGNRGQEPTTFHARSLDGGATWHVARTEAPGVSTVWPRVDPVVTFDGSGKVFATFATTDIEHGAWVLRSDDGGLTFGHAVPLATTSADKTWIAADPANNNIYATWVDVVVGESQRILLSRSTDGGNTFQAPVEIVDVGGSPMAAVDPDGRVYVIYRSLSLIDPEILLDRSLDGGVTWLGTDLPVSDVTIPPDPVTGNLKNPTIPTLAVDRSSGTYRGRLYVAWPDGRDGDTDVYLTHSSDQGNSWSTPVRVNDDYIGGGTDQVMPWLWIDDNGHVHLHWLDRREDPDNLLLSVYLATSTDGGATFGPNIRVSEPDLQQGGLPGRPNTWLGDYGGGVGAGGSNHIVWSDGRYGDLDVFLVTVDDADFDGDGVLNDGNGDGQYANAPCTGGQTTDCDDNCPGVVNAGQADEDDDGVGDACDNCPATPNADRYDRDRDGAGDACDPCPDGAGRPAGDPDGDGAAECVDNCPGVFNDTQADEDEDGIGDACDACLGDPDNDGDGDGVCDGVDNCLDRPNRVQADSEGDGVGNLCDVCPGDHDSDQADGDGDGRGDACDCEPTDRRDLNPHRVERLRAFRDGNVAHFGWIGKGVGGPGSSSHPGRGFSAYSVSRGLISSLGPGGDLGACLVEGKKRGFEDASVPPAGDGYFYLVQGQCFDCGMGSPGFDSSETERANTNPAACEGHPFTDVFATSETTIVGIVSGTLDDTLVSDDVYESILEEVILGVSQMEHRWTFDVPAGGLIEVHAEWYTIPSFEFEDLWLEYSTDGITFTPVTGNLMQLEDVDADIEQPIPQDISGTLILRVIDGNRGLTSMPADEILMDRLWIRSVP